MKTVYLPIEIYNRDFHSKSVLAYYLIKKNFSVILGRKAEIHEMITQKTQGIYFGVVTVDNYSSFYKKLKLLGHKIIVLDEEGLVTFEKKMYLDLKVSETTIKNIDHLLVWGNENKKILLSSKCSKFRNKIHVTGNPRIDLLKKKYSSIFLDNEREIIKNYGKFILINTSFSFSDHYTKNLDYLYELKKQKVIKNKKDEARFKDYSKIIQKTKKIFLDTIKELSEKYPKLNVVIRPHPSENHDLYLDLEKKYKNIFVNHSYSIQPWILSSMCIIHSYCTTAAEALVVNKKTFCLISNKNLKVHKNLPFIFNNVSYTKKEVLKKIDNFISKKKGINIQNDYRFYIKNISQRENSFNNIVKLIEGIKFKKEFINTGLIEKKNYFIKGLRNLFQNTIGMNIQKKKYINHKVLNISKKNIQGIFKSINENHSKLFKLVQINNQVVKIEKK